MGLKTVLPITILLLLSTSGCSYLFYPTREGLYGESKGNNGSRNVDKFDEYGGSHG